MNKPSANRHPKPPSRHPKPPAPRTGGSATAAAEPVAPATPKVKLPTAAIAATKLGKDYGDSIALAPLSLRIEDGQRVALIGHNGSGKTTFLRLAAGLLEPSEGTVTVYDHAAGSLEARRSLSYLADNPTFYEDLSVWEHLEYVARMHGQTEWQQRAADLLGELGLYERADDLPNSFSRGLKQKAAIALAFIRPFDVLLVDEPFVGLDSTGKRALVELFDAAAAEGATLVVATHELAFIEHCDRLVALRDGGLVYDGTPAGADSEALVQRADGRGHEAGHPSDDDMPRETPGGDLGDGATG
jgi:ABC-type multidrug transport system ATPase subunit